MPMAEAKPRHARILVVDDEPSMREFLTICLRRAGHEAEAAAGGEAALARLDAHRFDLVITDLTMPGLDGMELLRRVTLRPDPPLVVMITAFATTETAVQAMKLGAYDYLVKPFDVEQIQVVVRRALERVDLGSENQRLRDELRGVARLEGMVGRSAVMQKVFELVRRVAPTRANVLIRGESGTGKELVARAVHEVSPRGAQPFVAVNCSAIPEALLESELFGHVKGAFTGAIASRPGKFQLADKGTLFLDEIGELPLNLQVKLLRVLQSREVFPLGATMPERVDIRVVCATQYVETDIAWLFASIFVIVSRRFDEIIEALRKDLDADADDVHVTPILTNDDESYGEIRMHVPDDGHVALFSERTKTEQWYVR